MSDESQGGPSATQLDRIEKKLDGVSAIVHRHVGFIGAVQWLLGGAGAGITALIGWSWLHK